MNSQKLKQAIISQIEEVIKEEFGQCPKGLELDFPPTISLGDFTVKCFPLARQFHKSPVEVARKISALIERSDVIQQAQSVGSYINIKVPNKTLFGNICREIISQNDKFGETFAGKGTRVMVEYLAPNTNKPLHLGHLRNGAI